MAVYQDLQITITQYDFSLYLPNSGNQSTENENNIFINISYKIKNVSTTSIELIDEGIFSDKSYCFNLHYDKDYVYDSYYYVPDASGHSIISDSRIDPLETFSGYVCFEVPSEVENSNKSIELIYGKVAFFSDPYIYFELRTDTSE